MENSEFIPMCQVLSQYPRVHCNFFLMQICNSLCVCVIVRNLDPTKYYTFMCFLSPFSCNPSLGPPGTSPTQACPIFCKRVGWKKEEDINVRPFYLSFLTTALSSYFLGAILIARQSAKVD